MLPPALKLKVIQQASQGKLQKDIARDLGISTGSVSTILREERQQIAQIRHELQVTENKLIEVEELIPSAKQLKDIGTGFDQAIVWIDCIKEKTEIERISLREATWKLAQNLRAYRDLGGLSKAIQQATQQLSALNLVVEQRQRAFASLVDLQNKHGISDTELIELNKLIKSWGGWSQEQNNNGVNTVSRLARLDDKLHTPIN